MPARQPRAVLDNGLDGLVTVQSYNWDGYRDHSKDDSNSVYGNAGWEFGEGSDTRLYASWIDTDMDLPGTLSEEQMKEDPDQASTAALGGDYGKKVKTWRVADKTRWALSDNSSLEVGISWEEQNAVPPHRRQGPGRFRRAGPAAAAGSVQPAD